VRSTISLAATPRNPGAAPGRKRMPTNVAWLTIGDGPVSGPTTCTQAPSQTISMHPSGSTGGRHTVAGSTQVQTTRSAKEACTGRSTYVRTHSSMADGRFLQDAADSAS